MKKQKVVSVLLACLALMALTLASCDMLAGPKAPSSGGGRGIITITDIPSEFNGYYAAFQAYDAYRYGETNPESRRFVVGVRDVNIATQTITLGRISNGRVSLNMWWQPDYGSQTPARYYGNDTFIVSYSYPHGSDHASIVLEIGSNETNAYISGTIAAIWFQSVSFSNGSATLSANDAVEIPYGW